MLYVYNVYCLKNTFVLVINNNHNRFVVNESLIRVSRSQSRLRYRDKRPSRVRRNRIERAVTTYCRTPGTTACKKLKNSPARNRRRNS